MSASRVRTWEVSWPMCARPASRLLWCAPLSERGVWFNTGAARVGSGMCVRSVSCGVGVDPSVAVAAVAVASAFAPAYASSDVYACAYVRAQILNLVRKY